VGAPVPTVIRAILFDFDRTLVDLYDESSLGQLSKELVNLYRGFDYPSASMAARVDQQLAGISDLDHNPYTLWVSIDTMFRWRRPSVRRAVTRAAEQLIAQHELQAVERVRIRDGVIPTLEWIRASGISMAVVSTNNETAIQLALERTGLRCYLPHVIGRSPDSRMRTLKPSPRPVKQALRAVHCPRSKAIFVGDSINDVLAGKRARVCTVAVPSEEWSDHQLLRAGSSLAAVSLSDLRQFLQERTPEAHVPPLSDR
jgi:phosphoglycolate phosphatase-like HAD superfamily hydrolase